MDLSKLPKLSDTKSEIQRTPTLDHEPIEAIPTPVIALTRRSTIGGEIWFNFTVGILLMIMGRDFGHYLISRITQEPFHTNVFWPDDSPQAGKEVDYFDLTGFTALSDMGIFLFGIAVLFEVFSKLIAASPKVNKWRLYPIVLSWVMTVPITVLNCYVCFKLYNFGVEPILSGLAVAFGLWMIVDQWRLITNYSRRRQAFAQ